MRLLLLATLPILMAVSAPPCFSVGLGGGLPTGIRRDAFNLRPWFQPSLTAQRQLDRTHGLAVRHERVWAAGEPHRFGGAQVDRSLWGARFTAQSVLHPGAPEADRNLFLGTGAQLMWARNPPTDPTSTYRTLSGVLIGGLGWETRFGTGVVLRASNGRFTGPWNGTTRSEARVRVL